MFAEIKETRKFDNAFVVLVFICNLSAKKWMLFTSSTLQYSIFFHVFFHPTKILHSKNLTCTLCKINREKKAKRKHQMYGFTNNRPNSPYFCNQPCCYRTYMKIISPWHLDENHLYIRFSLIELQVVHQNPAPRTQKYPYSLQAI